MRKLSTILLILLCTASLALAQKTSITISVTDKVTGEAIPEADVSLNGDSGSSRAKTDDSCRAVVSSNKPNPRYLDITVKKASYGTMAARWRNVTADKPLPEQVAVALEPSITISCFVKDENGKPVKNATVRFHGGGTNEHERLSAKLPHYAFWLLAGCFYLGSGPCRVDRSSIAVPIPLRSRLFPISSAIN